MYEVGNATCMGRSVVEMGECQGILQCLENTHLEYRLDDVDIFDSLWYSYKSNQ